jgi:thioredoxin-dependent peroxiredoxin
VKEGDMTAQLEAGDKAPDFNLPGDAGEALSLRKAKGGKLVLYFYPKDDTEACTAEAIAFNGLRAQFAKAGTQIFGISPDSIKSHEKFKRKHGLELTLAADEGRAALEAYGVWKEKSLYGRKYMGVERTTILIDGKGAIARIWRKVRVRGHAEEVLEAARAL